MARNLLVKSTPFRARWADREMLQPHFSPKLRILFPKGGQIMQRCYVMVRLAQGFPQGLACSFARCLVLSTEECG